MLNIKPWALLSSSLLAISLVAAEPVAPPKPLAPGADDAPITQVVIRLLAQRQYNHQQLNDELASRFLDRYLDALDPQHLFFFQSDLKEWEKLRTTLDEATWSKGDTAPAYAIFSRLLERVEQQRKFVENDLKTGTFTFDKDETYSIDRKKAPRPKDQADAERLWHERLRFEYLQEKLNNQKPEEIAKTLNRRYEGTLRTLRQYDSDEVLELYLTTLAHVFDPHSDYLGAASFEDFGIRMKLSLFGIGAVLRTEDGYCKVVEVTAGGPAAKSGQIKSGDKIIQVAQGKAEPVDVVDMKLSKVVEMIRGPKGTEVRLTIIPADAADPSTRKTVVLVRDEIKLEEQEAKAKVIDLPAQGAAKGLRLGVINLPSFYAETGTRRENRKSATTDTARLLKKLVQVGVDGVVLDLRNNGGGSLDEAIRLTGLFIKDGPVVQVKDPDGSVRVDRDPDPTVAYSGPLVVLTNRGTASASEILAGALQDYGRAVVVGDSSTFGKGTVQSLLPLGGIMQQAKLPTQRDPGALKLTIQKFYRPSGASTQLEGVVPDIVLPSLTDQAEVGEKIMDDPLPFDTIKSTTYTKVGQVQPYLAELRKRSQERLASDKDFARLKEEIDQFRKTVSEKQVSLNEQERRKAKEEATARTKRWKDELAARPASHEKVTTLTLKQVDAPGLPTPDAAATGAGTDNRTASVTAETGEPKSVGPDLVLEEGKRILLDLISLSKDK